MKIALIEDQSLVREALKALLNLEPDFEVVFDCENGKDALAYLKENSVDLVLTDIEMPEMTGIELCEKLETVMPSCKRVIVTTFGKAGYIKRALNSGVDGFLLKDAHSQELADSLRKVMGGHRAFNAELALLALDEQDPLTGKERKALRLASEGKTTQEIASNLFLSEGTVRNYLSEAIAKLNATNRIDAARIAHQKGWL